MSSALAGLYAIVEVDARGEVLRGTRSSVCAFENRAAMRVTPVLRMDVRDWGVRPAIDSSESSQEDGSATLARLRYATQARMRLHLGTDVVAYHSVT